MKATILLATLKKEGLSNTETLTEFLTTRLEKKKVTCEVIKLVQHNILPGTYTDMGAGDEWPSIFSKLKEADIIIFATPIWWCNHSSEMQRAIERLDEVHDILSSGKPSPMGDKAVGIVVTGDSDGAQHIVGGISNFANGIGMSVPPYCTLTVLSADHEKQKKPTKEELLAKYEKNYAKEADTMVEQLIKAVG
jgi:multimeric flavodoxin WrbA